MDINSTLMGLLIILCCIIPAIIIQYKRNQKEKRKRSVIEQKATNLNCKIKDYDANENFSLALSDDNKILFLLLNSETENEVETILLEDFNACKINTLRSTIVKNGLSESHIQTLELELIAKTTGTKNKKLEFYDASKSFELHNELISIKKWNSLIGKCF